jgi:thiol-disulfide isomerase/thioredoxin
MALMPSLVQPVKKPPTIPTTESLLDAPALPSGMEEQGRWTALAFLLLLLLPVGHANAVRVDPDTTWDGVVSATAKRGVLVEELTATWCEVCAEVDPYLAEVADRHGTRLVLIGLHDDDGRDGVSTAASVARVERWRTLYPDLASTPSFVVEGEEPIVGRDAWTDVTRRILAIEGEKETASDLGMNLNRQAGWLHVDGGVQAENRQTTLMLLHHGRTARDGSIEVVQGEAYERVLIELHVRNSTGAWTSTCDGGCMLEATSPSNFSVDIDLSRFSLVLVNEVADHALASGVNTLSDAVVELAVRPSAVEDPNGHRWTLTAAFAFAGCGLLLLPRRFPEKSGFVSEEE